MKKIQKIGVSAFIHNDSKILLVKRSGHKKFLPLFYELPGGKVEFGETAEGALKREIKEETGLIIEIKKPCSTFSYIMEKEKHFIDIQFLTTTKNFEDVKLSEEHEDYKWASIEEIPALKMTEEMRNIILECFNNINNN